MKILKRSYENGLPTGHVIYECECGRIVSKSKDSEVIHCVYCGKIENEEDSYYAISDENLKELLS